LASERVPQPGAHAAPFEVRDHVTPLLVGSFCTDAMNVAAKKFPDPAASSVTSFWIVTAMAATVMLIEADFNGFSTDVAVTDTVKFEDTEAGALYVIDVGVRFVSEPQDAPVQPEPESAHVTFGVTVLLLLLVTVATTFTVWPCSMVGAEAGAVMVTLIDELELLPPHPAAKKPTSIPNTA